MKNKLFAVAVLAALSFAGSAYAAPATRSDVSKPQIVMAQDQQAPTPSAENEAAYAEFQDFAKAHMLNAFGRYHLSDDGKTITSFDLALANDDETVAWIVYGYPTVKEAAAQIEADFAKYPGGNPEGTTYQAPDDKKSADNRVHVASN